MKERLLRQSFFYRNQPSFIYDMFVAEMLNHECGYVMDSSEALDALELTLEEIEANAALKKGYEKALYYVMGD